jgi:hypothetical protein
MAALTGLDLLERLEWLQGAAKAAGKDVGTKFAKGGAPAKNRDFIQRLASFYRLAGGSPSTTEEGAFEGFLRAVFLRLGKGTKDGEIAGLRDQIRSWQRNNRGETRSKKAEVSPFLDRSRLRQIARRKRRKP